MENPGLIGPLPSGIRHEGRRLGFGHRITVKLATGPIGHATLAVS
jgi:hypothetical protein